MPKRQERRTLLKNIILKICEGDLYRFVDSEERTELLVGSRRTADLCSMQTGNSGGTEKIKKV